MALECSIVSTESVRGRTAYLIKVIQGERETVVRKHYTDFCRLDQDDLVQRLPRESRPTLPPKGCFGPKCQMENISTRPPGFVSFDDAPDLLRASSLTQVLGRGARIFRESGGDETTYALSHPATTTGIDSFLSHNWSTPWTRKFVALSFNFELWRAVCGSLLLQILCVFLSGAGLLPTVETPGPHLGPGRELHTGVFCRLLGVPAFLILFLTMTEIRRWLGLQGQSVFLDKTCIHQSNKTLQRAGICKLGAFLCHSKRMVVLYTDEYLTRLWTVYEFACFLTFHPTGDIDLVSVSLANFFLIALVPIYLTEVFVLVMEGTSSVTPSVVNIIAVFIMAPCLCSHLRASARRLESYQKQAADFTVQACVCACEEDRPLVLRNVAELMRFTGVVSPTSAQEEALAAFDHITRTKLPVLARDAIGRCGVNYSTCCVLGIFMLIPKQLDACVQLFYGMLWKEFAALMAMYILQCFVFDPAICFLCGSLQGRNLHLASTCEKLYILGCSWLGAVICMACLFFQELMWELVNFELEWQAGVPWALCMGAIVIHAVGGIAVVAWAFEMHQVCGAKQSPACQSHREGSVDKEEEKDKEKTTRDVRETEFLDPSQWEHVSLDRAR